MSCCRKVPKTEQCCTTPKYSASCSIKTWITISFVFVVLVVITGVVASSIAKTDNPSESGYFWINPFTGTFTSSTIDNGDIWLVVAWVLFFLFLIGAVFCHFKVFYLAPY